MLFDKLWDRFMFASETTLSPLNGLFHFGIAVGWDCLHLFQNFFVILRYWPVVFQPAHPLNLWYSCTCTDCTPVPMPLAC